MASSQVAAVVKVEAQGAVYNSHLVEVVFHLHLASKAHDPAVVNAQVPASAIQAGVVADESQRHLGSTSH